MLLEDEIISEALDQSFKFGGRHAEEEAVLRNLAFEQKSDGRDIMRGLVRCRTCPIAAKLDIAS